MTWCAFEFLCVLPFTFICDRLCEEVRRDWNTRSFANENVDVGSEVLEISSRALEAAKFEFDKQVWFSLRCVVRPACLFVRAARSSRIVNLTKDLERASTLATTLPRAKARTLAKVAVRAARHVFNVGRRVTLSRIALTTRVRALL